MQVSTRISSRISSRTGAILFWGSSLVFGASSLGVLAVLSHHLAPGGFAATSAVFALAFVTAVVPSSIQLRAAAMRGAGGNGDTVPWRAVWAITGALLVAAPALGPVLALPSAAVALVAVQIVPSVALGARRGALIGGRWLTAAGASLGVEAVVRFVAGVAMGLAWQGAGVAAALALATLVALAVVPRSEDLAISADGLVTPFVPTVLSLGALMLLANIDVIVAPAALGATAADSYDLAAVPAKGILAGLLAAGWLAVPGARSRRGPRHVLAPVGATVLLGLAAAVAVVALRPLIALLFGRAEPDALLLVLLAVAMAAAAGTSVCVHLAVALGAPRPWIPTAAASAAIALLASTHPAPQLLAAGVLAVHVAALLISLRMLTTGTR